MDVAVSELRAGLRSWVERARQGESVTVTERGVPVARLVAVDSGDLLERLEREGAISPPAARRTPASSSRRVRATGPVADLVAELRR